MAKLTRYWNELARKGGDWPNICLAVPPIERSADDILEEDFPGSLKVSIEGYLDILRHKHKTANGKTWRPCSEAAIATRKREINAVIRAAAKIGHEPSSLQTLADLCHLDMVEKIIDHYWARNGDVPNTYTIDLGWKLKSIAYHVADFDEASMKRLEEMVQELEIHRDKSGLTEKNMKIVRLVTETGTWPQVVALPATLLAKAQAIHNRSPMKAAHLAELAVAIRLLLVVPVRMANLMSGFVRGT